MEYRDMCVKYAKILREKIRKRELTPDVGVWLAQRELGLDDEPISLIEDILHALRTL